MTDTPSWLSPQTTAAPLEITSSPAVATIKPAGGPTITVDDGGGSAAAGMGATSATDIASEELPAIILIMRLANMGAAVALIVVSILLIISLPSLSALVLSVYAICGGVLICCLETQLKFLRVMIAVNFGFLFHPVWRFVFYLVLASVTWGYDSLLGRIMAIVIAALAVVNTYILCRYPSYRKIREKIAEEEDKKIEARIAKQVRQQTINQLTRTG